MTVDTHETEDQKIARVTGLINAHFPTAHDGGAIQIEAMTDSRVVVRLCSDPSQIRPGGTVSGPAMFKLADVSVYVAVLGWLGEAALQAVTTNMTINFMRRPAPGDLVAHCEILKRGRRLTVGDIKIYAASDMKLVAQATSTYAMP